MAIRRAGYVLYRALVKLGDNVDELAVPGVIKGSATRLLQRIDYGLHFIVEITVRPGKLPYSS